MTLMAHLIDRGCYSDPEGEINRLPASFEDAVAIHAEEVARAVRDEGISHVENTFISSLEHLPIRPPYETVFIEWEWGSGQRSGALVARHDDDDVDGIECILFIDDTPAPVTLGGVIINVADDGVTIETATALSVAGQSAVEAMAANDPAGFAGLSDAQRDARALSAAFGIGVITTALRLMHVKNVALAEAPVRKRSKKQRRVRTDDLIQWHTLVVSPAGSSRAPSAGGASSLMVTSQHLVRGHFKTYTPERPLLGRFSGTFWFAPHVRGSDEVGVIEKDYRLRVPDPDAPSEGTQ